MASEIKQNLCKKIEEKINLLVGTPSSLG